MKFHDTMSVPTYLLDGIFSSTRKYLLFCVEVFPTEKYSINEDINAIPFKNKICVVFQNI